MAAIAINCPLCQARMSGGAAITFLRYSRHLRKCKAFADACKAQKADPVASAAHLVKLARAEHSELTEARA